MRATIVFGLVCFSSCLLVQVVRPQLFEDALTRRLNMLELRFPGAIQRYAQEQHYQPDFNYQLQLQLQQQQQQLQLQWQRQQQQWHQLQQQFQQYQQRLQQQQRYLQSQPNHNNNQQPQGQSTPAPFVQPTPSDGLLSDDGSQKPNQNPVDSQTIINNDSANQKREQQPGQSTPAPLEQQTPPEGLNSNNGQQQPGQIPKSMTDDQKTTNNNPGDRNQSQKQQQGKSSPAQADQQIPPKEAEANSHQQRPSQNPTNLIDKQGANNIEDKNTNQVQKDEITAQETDQEPRIDLIPGVE